MLALSSLALALTVEKDRTSDSVRVPPVIYPSLEDSWPVDWLCDVSD